MVFLTRLRDLRPVLVQQARGTLGRPDDRNVSGPVWVGALIHDDHQVPAVRQRLRCPSVPYRPPSNLPASRRTKPLRLRICQQNLAVFRRPQQVHSQPFPYRRREC